MSATTSSTHTEAARFLTGEGIDLKLHMHSEDVAVMSLLDLLLLVGGCRVGFLKVDAEGFDPALLVAYARYLAAYPQCYADRVQVEFNEQSRRGAQVRALRFIEMFGYGKSDLAGDDITLFYSKEHDLRQVA
jgi:hypothetical protein